MTNTRSSFSGIENIAIEGFAMQLSAMARDNRKQFLRTFTSGDESVWEKKFVHFMDQMIECANNENLDRAGIVRALIATDMDQLKALLSDVDMKPHHPMRTIPGCPDYDGMPGLNVEQGSDQEKEMSNQIGFLFMPMAENIRYRLLHGMEQDCINMIQKNILDIRDREKRRDEIRFYVNSHINRKKDAFTDLVDETLNLTTHRDLLSTMAIGDVAGLKEILEEIHIPDDHPLRKLSGCPDYDGNPGINLDDGSRSEILFSKELLSTMLPMLSQTYHRERIEEMEEPRMSTVWY